MMDANARNSSVVVAVFGWMLVVCLHGCADPIDERIRRAESRLQEGNVSRAVAMAKGVLEEAPGHWAARSILARADIQRNKFAAAENHLVALERDARGLDEADVPGLPDDGFANARRMTRRLYDRWSEELVPKGGDPSRTDDRAVEILRLAYGFAVGADERDAHARSLAEVLLAPSNGGMEALNEAARWAPFDSGIRQRVLKEWKSSARRVFRAEWSLRQRMARVDAGVWNGGGNGGFERIGSEAEVPAEWTGDDRPANLWRGSFDVSIDRTLDPDTDAGVEAARATVQAHLVGRLRRVALALVDLPIDTDLNDLGRRRAVDALVSGVAARDVVIHPGQAKVTVWFSEASLRRMAFELEWLLETNVHGRTLEGLGAAGCIVGAWVLEVIRRGGPDISEPAQSADACRRQRREVRDRETYNVDEITAECVCRVDS